MSVGIANNKISIFLGWQIAVEGKCIEMLMYA